MKFLLSIYACIILFCSLSTTLQAQAVTVSPSILRFTAAPGKAEVKTISIRNNAKKPVTFKIYLQDWLLDSNGNFVYYRSDTLFQSCAKMVSIEPSSYIRIDSGKIGKIEVRMQPSATASNTDMKWAMLFIESLPDEQQQEKSKSKKLGMQVNMSLQIGIHIYQTPPGAITKAVEGVAVSVDSVQKGFVNLHMKNVGQVMLACKAHLELNYLSTGEEVVTEGATFSVFPNGFRKVKLNLPKNLKPGEYSLLAILDYGPDMPLEAVQKNITIK